MGLWEKRVCVRRCSSKGQREGVTKAMTEILRKDWYRQEEGNECVLCWGLVAESSEG